MNPADGRNLQVISNLAIEKLQSVREYSEWLREMQRELPDCHLPMNAVWALLPRHIERDFESFCDRCLEALSIDTEIEDCGLLLWKWARFDFERRMKTTPMRNRTSQPWANEPGHAASSFREKAVAYRGLRLASLAAQRHHEETEKRRAARKGFAMLCFAALVGGWVFSPLGWFSVSLFSISVGYLAWSKLKKRYFSLSARACLFLFLFLVGGISRDLLDDVQPTAVCSDGSYSNSAHRSGTCSWHGGVAGWNPTVHHWWQTVLGI